MRHILWLTISGLLAIAGTGQSAERQAMDLSPGKIVPYRYRQESTVSISVNRREQEETIVSVIDLTATVWTKDDKGRVPVELRVSRVQDSVKAFSSKAENDTDKFDPDDPLPLFQLAPNLAWMHQPVQLLFDGGGSIVGIKDADKLQTKVEEILQKDFGGSEEYTFASPIYASETSEVALLVKWADVLGIQFPRDFLPGSNWKKSNELEVVGVIPSESWMGLMKVSSESTYSSSDLGDGKLHIVRESKIVSGKAKETQLGPVDCKYSVESGSGQATVHIGADGWVGESEGASELVFSATIGLEGKTIPLKMTVQRNTRIERVKK